MKAHAHNDHSPEWDPRSFYDRQDELTGAYADEVSDYHRSKAALVGLHCGRTRHVLELGAGGGQVAVATAELGFAVDAVELVPRLAARARALAATQAGQVNVIEGDFYTLTITGPYGAVTYWDGFGIGTDRDQQALLRRIREWLAGDGRALIDIYAPWYWERVAGREETFGSARRRYEFDTQTRTIIDTWWSDDAPQERVSQRLRCYAPNDLRFLLEPVGLTAEALLPGGAYDYQRAIYQEKVPLEEAMSYTAVIARASPALEHE
jgi:SAM-dependent methyltransferase